MKYVNAFLGYIILIILVIFLSTWLFNHVNPWGGLLCLLVGVYGLILKTFKYWRMINEKN